MSATGEGVHEGLGSQHLVTQITNICLVAVDTGGELEGGVGGIEVGRHDLVDGTLVCDECVVQHATEACQKGKEKTQQQ